MKTPLKDKDTKESPLTEKPLSEKDEVKAAEQRTMKAQDQSSVKGELKNRTDDKKDQEKK